jgi:hypothetical protein
MVNSNVWMNWHKLICEEFYVQNREDFVTPEN